MSGLTVTAITPTPINAWQITTETAQDAVAAINTLLLHGYKIQINPANNNGVLAWAITITAPNTPPVVANDGDWIVLTGNQLSKCNGLQFLATYTTNTPLVWDATTTAPTVTLHDDGTATITFPQPTSANGPWTFPVTLTDNTLNTSGAAALSGDPVTDSNGNVTLTAIDLPAGDEISFTVDCTTQYDGVHGTSLPTDTVTVPAAPAPEQ